MIIIAIVLVIVFLVINNKRIAVKKHDEELINILKEVQKNAKN